ncbi:MAG TPA: 50S ribosomal protein L3 [Polyangiaceae bacterium]|nr:50S ribosomal protein L3 [Polyangiaceae bacterium]
MNQHPGVIGLKLGMTQVVEEDGTVVPCTVIEARPVVVAKRSVDKDGYTALVLGTGVRKEKHTNKPLQGFYKKTGGTPKRTLREFRCSVEEAAKYEVGAELGVDAVFAQGQFVDVRGISRGHGFTGVMRRHNFKGSRSQTHGTHEYQRHGGSIGGRKTPGRTFLGQGMPGQHGNVTKSVLNQPVVRVLPEQNLILVRGGVPGARNALVEVRGAVKKRGGLPKS